MNRQLFMTMAAMALMGSRDWPTAEEVYDGPSKKQLRREREAMRPLDDRRPAPKDKSKSLRRMLGRKGRV